ncbi:MAG: hypothetical protein AAF202_04035, partial [Pseudomonadota bacterium]
MINWIASLILVSTFAWEVVRAEGGQLLQISGHVVAEKSLSLPGDSICRGQTHVHYKSFQSCAENRVFSNCSSLEVAPIRELETIRLSNQDRVARMHKIDLFYDVNSYQKIEFGNGDYDLALVGTTQNEVRPCQGLGEFEPEIVFSERSARSMYEEHFLHNMQLQGYFLINSPKGTISDFSMLDIHSPNIDIQKLPEAILDRHISSPLCDQNASDLLSTSRGGEFSGNRVL